MLLAKTLPTTTGRIVPPAPSNQMTPWTRPSLVLHTMGLPSIVTQPMGQGPSNQRLCISSPLLTTETQI